MFSVFYFLFFVFCCLIFDFCFLFVVFCLLFFDFCFLFVVFCCASGMVCCSVQDVLVFTPLLMLP
jgi:hypothetical protein